MASGRLLQLLKGAGGERGLHSKIAAWRIAVSTALGPWEGSLPLPWPGDICSGPLLDGADRTVVPAGSLYPGQVLWKLGGTNLLRVTYTRDTQHLVTNLKWEVFDTSGSLVMTVTDTITYSGLVEVSRTRAVTL